MHNKIRFKSAVAILLLSSIVFIASTQRTNTWFFDPFENMVEETLQTIENITLNLSNDIMCMADNIGIMADRILLWRIGLMKCLIVCIYQRVNTFSYPWKRCV